MISEDRFDEQIALIQKNFQITLTPLQIAAIGKQFLNNPNPDVLTLEFTEEQWQKRVAAHPIESWVAEGAREFEIELIDDTLTSRIKGAIGMKD